MRLVDRFGSWMRNDFNAVLFQLLELPLDTQSVRKVFSFFSNRALFSPREQERMRSKMMIAGILRGGKRIPAPAGLLRSILEKSRL